MKSLKNLHLLWFIAGLSLLTFLFGFLFLFNESSNGRHIDELNHDLQESGKVIEQERTEGGKLRSQLQELSGRFEALSGFRIGQLENSLQAARKDVANLKQDLQSLRGELNNTNSILNKTFKDLKESRSSAKMFESRLKDMEQTIAELKKATLKGSEANSGSPKNP